MLEKKLEINENDLCVNLPEEFVEVLVYIKNLSFEEKPNYDYVRNIFRKI